MRKGWERRTIAELAEHSLGKMLDKAKNRGELLPYLRNLNVRWFGFNLADLQTMRFLVGEEARYTVRKGDLVVCEGGYPGRAAIWEQDEPIYFQKALHRVRFHEPFHARWCLYYLLHQDAFGELRRCFSGTGIQHFTGEALAGFTLPLPPLPEQHRIVALLDEAFAGIAKARENTERNLENAREVFETRLQSVFASPTVDAKWTTLGQEIDLLAGYAFKSRDYMDAGDGVRLLRGDNIIQGSIRWQDAKLWPSSDLTDFERYRLEVQDVVLAMDRPWVKAGLKRAVISESDLPCLLVQRTARMRTRSGLDHRFLFHLLASSAFVQHILGVQTGIGVPHISGQQIMDFRFRRPALVEQTRIASLLDSLWTMTTNLTALYHQKLAALDALKQSLLRQAFHGDL